MLRGFWNLPGLDGRCDPRQRARDRHRGRPITAKGLGLGHLLANGGNLRQGVAQVHVVPRDYFTTQS